MKKGLLAFVVLLGMSLQLWAQKPTKSDGGSDNWKILWSISDEFADDTPNWNKWIKSSGLPNTTGWKWDNQNNVKINNGVAELTMTHNAGNVPNGGTYFESGILKSYRTMTNGYYEAKIKGASIGEGVCPSFWLFSDFDRNAAEGEPVYCEVDVVELQQFDWFEGIQDDIYDMDLNLHAVVKQNGQDVWLRPKPNKETQLNKWRAPWDPRDEFHIYGCEVNDSEIIWYVDGNEVARKPNTYWKRPMNITLSLGLRKPFVKFYDNANHAVNPVTDPDANAKLSQIPTTMYVDYVRVWEKIESDDIEVTGVSVSSSTKNLNTGASFTLVPTVSPQNATNKSVTFSSSKTSVATVTSSGVVTAKSVGTAIITVTTTNGKTAKCTVNVTSSGSSGGNNSENVYIRNRHTGKDIRPLNNIEGSQVKHATLSTDNYTQWLVVDAGNGWFHLKNAETGMYLRPTDNSNGSIMIQSQTQNNWTQWEKISSSSNFFYLKNRQTAQYFRPSTADVMEVDLSNRSALRQRPTSVALNWTQWQFIKVSDGSLLKSASASENVLTPDNRKATLKVFPNPASDIISIEGLNMVKDETLIAIYNSNGTMVKSELIPTGIKHTMNISDFPSGVYFVKADNNQTVKLLVK